MGTVIYNVEFPDWMTAAFVERVVFRAAVIAFAFRCGALEGLL
jgi:hypothetical protein